MGRQVNFVLLRISIFHDKLIPVKNEGPSFFAVLSFFVVGSSSEVANLMLLEAPRTDLVHLL